LQGNEVLTLPKLRLEANSCTRCPLYKNATQTVFGEGSARAKLMLVGEQPGDQEDLVGRPFVGPAGKLLDRALDEAGIDRKDCYVTNAVKHFKYEIRGKKRLHQKPNSYEIDKCRWWLDREISLVRSGLIVALGATAAASLLGRSATISKLRGRPLTFSDHPGWVTVHPSYLLRIAGRDAAAREYEHFVADLRQAAAHADKS